MEKEKNEKKIKNEDISKEYKEINKKYKKSEIYTDGFTSDQVFYQIEELCDEVLKENEKKVEKMYKKFLTLSDKKIKISEHVEDTRNEVDSNDDSEKDEDISEVDSNENDASEDFNEEDDDDSEAFERQKIALENAESTEDSDEVDEDTLSDEGSIEDPEEIKNIPAADLFKRLDKNINKKK